MMHCVCFAHPDVDVVGLAPLIFVYHVMSFNNSVAFAMSFSFVLGDSRGC
jgi:hypothetical protein